MAVTSQEILVITNFNAFMKTATTQQYGKNYSKCKSTEKQSFI